MESKEAVRERVRRFRERKRNKALFSCGADGLMLLDDLSLLRQPSVPIGKGKSHIYFLFTGDEIVYIGQTRQLLGRISDHLRGNGAKEFDSLSVIEVPGEQINSLELAYIEKFKPKYNINGKYPTPVTPVTGICNACNDKDTANAILRAKVLMLERELALLKKERKGLDAVGIEGAKVSPYRLGPGV